jgi:hypothetical protein
MGSGRYAGTLPVFGWLKQRVHDAGVSWNFTEERLAGVEKGGEIGECWIKVRHSQLRNAVAHAEQA